MSVRTPVLMLGIDAANEAEVDALAAQGRMPALAALRASGTSGSLASCADRYAGGVWPSFYTGRDVPWHGIYHNKLWRPEAMRYEVPTDRWLPARLPSRRCCMPVVRKGCWRPPLAWRHALAGRAKCPSNGSWVAAWAGATAAWCRCAARMADAITCDRAWPGRSWMPTASCVT